VFARGLRRYELGNLLVDARMTDDLIEAIERAIVSGVAPRALEALPGWLLPIDPGSVGRARSAVPLRHVGIDAALVPEIIARYLAHGRQPRFRLADVAGLSALHTALAAQGYAPMRPTRLQLTAADTLAATGDAHDIAIDAAPDAAWIEAFLGDEAPAPQAAIPERVAMLMRRPSTCFASLRAQSEVVAVGAASFAHGLACVHGMRTRPEQRAQGYGARVLGALARAASTRGVEQLFLQVEADNQPALALYRRAGFATLWQYRYWLIPDEVSAARP
jgi:ribosomal protein S18 acetylase RimI-like enzyme